MNIKALFLLTIKFRIYESLKNFGGIEFFSVNQLENNGRLGNKESTVYSL